MTAEKVYLKDMRSVYSIFENIQGIDNVRLRTVYFAAVVDCMNMLVKLGYKDIKTTVSKQSFCLS